MKRVLTVCVAILFFGLMLGNASLARSQELLPKHVNDATQKAVKKGLDYLAKSQNHDGSWTNSRDGGAYPITMASLAGMAFLANGNTPSRGPYAPNVRKTIDYLLSCCRSDGMITGPAQEQGRPMYGHGFATMFLASAYGMESDERDRQTMKKSIVAAVEFIGRAQSAYGGWTYVPGMGDEGSVTVTQIMGLRAAMNAGFTIPKGVIEESIRYLERCKTPEGGISYSLGSGSGPRLPISAAAVATLYNAGEYDSRLAEQCLNYVAKAFNLDKGNFAKDGGHDYYTHMYASQAFYQSGDKYWNDYFPPTRDQFLRMQAADGSWHGDGIGPVYGTSIALTVLQLPYKFLPIYQR